MEKLRHSEVKWSVRVFGGHELVAEAPENRTVTCYVPSRQVSW